MLETDQLSLSNDDDITTQLSSTHQEQPRRNPGLDIDDQTVSKPKKPLKGRLRKNKINAFSNSIDSGSDGGDCNNPFDCPPKFKAAGRRPRVKSNLRARKRNFWQKNKNIDGNIIYATIIATGNCSFSLIDIIPCEVSFSSSRWKLE